MKAFKVLAILSVFSITILTGCSKKSDDVNPDPATGAAGFKVKVDGKEYAPDFSYALASFPANDQYYAIYGLDSKTNDVVAIALPNTVKEGTFPINNVNFAVMTFNKQDFSTINGGSGTITITKRTDSNIQGTFSLTAVDATGTLKRTLTDGSFNVNVR
ncbi:hypothetical protein SAMN05216327_105356 [Dyadobacter sp. SG02]|uniref:DUF6252 family protein n=1 Tax=Dyadobacter sp. SG02 TaxID=1855291 RepID=UPI0008C91B6C|nr:DUF6252 family protein [Dyadobacter sp. SG02]SEJ02842.1 hypothetical protein SAMN05216327_105356 [Dyadobacter sp. SG02]